MESLEKSLEKIIRKYIDGTYKEIDTNIIANEIMDILSGIEDENEENVC